MPYSSGPEGHTPTLSEVNFIMVEIPTPKPYIFMIRVNKKIKCPKSWSPGLSPSSTGIFFENYTYLGNHFVNFNQTLPKRSLGDPLSQLCSYTNIDVSVGIQEAYWTDHKLVWLQIPF